MKEPNEAEADVVKLLMDLSYLSAMIAVDIEEDKAAGMERLSLEFEQLDDLLAEIDEQMFNFNFARSALANQVSKRALLKMKDVYHTPKTVQ
ncbi:hypothetical protein GL267_008615 [Acidithiobacillus ferrianus]|uniref:Uncharacterized protein n=2 Tax=Acidithiobacillus ferrianus TaxID=2678518 RepID=A0A845UPN8_9PROT|nr:hypothetical protein [Acidithiobacillus ferrianus]NDU43498.1 hypothetical protein [Acidithiobacillus ferrianus]